jgi:hypothetical protein
VPLVEQELLTLFYRFFVVFVLLNLLVLCEMFCGSLLVFWSLYCLYFFDLRLLITYVDIFQHLVRAGLHVNVYICSGSSNHSVFVLLSFFVLSLCCLYFFDLRILITPLVCVCVLAVQFASSWLHKLVGNIMNCRTLCQKIYIR